MIEVVLFSCASFVFLMVFYFGLWLIEKASRTRNWFVRYLGGAIGTVLTLMCAVVFLGVLAWATWARFTTGLDCATPACRYD
jgi:hypothetical protein